MKSLLQRVRAHPRLGALGIVVVLAATGAGIYVGTGGSSAAAAPTTTVQTVATGTIKQAVSATGTLAPASAENLNFSASGQVTSVTVKAGQKVTKGQKLATIDSAALAASVAQVEATVANDQAKIDNDASSGATSTQTAADTAALTAASNQLTSAKAQLAGATMTSPIDGVVASVALTVGQSVSGTSSSSAGSSGSGGSGAAGGATGGTGGGSSSTSTTSTAAQVLVISTDSWIVNASVDATSVGLIKAGEQAQLSITGATGSVYGTIASIGLVSSSTTGTASYPVVVDVTGSPSGLYDGANVTASLIYKQLTNVIVVPTTALHRSSSGGVTVDKQVNGKSVPTTVQVGIASGGQTQIVSGVAAGDKIVIPVPQTTGRTGGAGAGTGGVGGGFGGGAGGGGFGGGAGGGGFGGAGRGGGTGG
jgi:macrolide-specific efflux system membrane fusion protein